MSQAEEGRKKGAVRCSALRKDGEPCRNWARRGPDGHVLYDPPRCQWHAPDEGGKEAHLPAAQPAAAAGEQGIVIDPSSGRAFYAPFFGDAELAALGAIREPNRLEGEIMLVRGLMRWLLVDAQRKEPLTGHALERRTGRLFAGTETLARLLQAERELEKGADGIPLPIAEALDEIGEEWGIDL